jgi:hypothetical protein
MASVPGKVYVASMNLRGTWAEKPIGATVVNVTSAQATANKNRRDFSPMTFLEGGYRGYANFEAFYQSLKRFEGIDPKKVEAFWKKVSPETGSKRRYPGSKGKVVTHCELEGEHMDYVTTRKKVYVPFYFDMMKDREMMLHWKKQVEEGKDVVVFDFDGPRNEDHSVSCLEVTCDMLINKIHDTRHPFGHGYVVAAWLKGIAPEEYV